ncbi:putative addiction module antidote protein [bacterium]|nr:putative addiction module antidote protein [bacterium]
MTNKNVKNFNLDELIENQLKTQEDIKEWLNIALEEYLLTNDSTSFIKALEDALKAKDTISNISKKTGISRSNIYSILKGEVKPQLETVLKIFKELGYSIKIA